MILEFFSFFTFPKKWVGRAMVNEAFNWDGLNQSEHIKFPDVPVTRLLTCNGKNKEAFPPLNLFSVSLFFGGEWAALLRARLVKPIFGSRIFGLKFVK